MAVVTRAPSLAEIRQQLGKPIPEPTPNLERARECAIHAWRLYEYVIAHLMYASRQTIGPAAKFWVIEQLQAWTKDDHDFEGLADELVAEANDHRVRP